MDQTATQPFAQTQEGEPVHKENLVVRPYNGDFILMDKTSRTILCMVTKREEDLTFYQPILFGNTKSAEALKELGDLKNLRESNISPYIVFTDKMVTETQEA